MGAEKKEKKQEIRVTDEYTEMAKRFPAEIEAYPRDRFIEQLSNFLRKELNK